MKTKRLYPVLIAAVVICAVAACLVLVSGCGEDKQKQQDFVDGYLGVIEYIEARPQIASEGQQAGMAYYNSGYTDLESARKAGESFTESIKLDEEGIRKLRDVEKPDEDSGQISGDLEEGISKVDQGNATFAEMYASAPQQTVEERQAAGQEALAAMGMYVEGLEKILASLEDLKEYVLDNGLEGESEIDQWTNRFQGELEGMKQYTSQ